MPDPVKGKLAARSENTRRALLEAGLELLLKEPASGAFAHLTANRVASKAGRTTGAFFHQWPDLQAYQDELVAYALAPERSEAFRALEPLKHELEKGERDDGFHHAVLGAAHQALEATRTDPHTIVELLIWNRAARDEAFRKTVEVHYPKLDAYGAELYQRLLDGMGREMRPPFTTATLAAVSAAIAQGLSLRDVVTPGFYPRDIFGWIMVVLGPLFTRVPGQDDRDAGDVARAIARELAPNPR